MTRKETRLIVLLSFVGVGAVIALAFRVGQPGADVAAAVAVIAALSAAGVSIAAYVRAMR